MNCSQCDHPNGADRNYCGACGNPLTRHCGRCGFRNQTSDRFCGGCGTPMAEAAARQEVRETTPAPRPPSPSSARPAPDPARQAPAPALAELLAAAREGSDQHVDEGEIRVSQGDIDNLFED